MIIIRPARPFNSPAKFHVFEKMSLKCCKRLYEPIRRPELAVFFAWPLAGYKIIYLGNLDLTKNIFGGKNKGIHILPLSHKSGKLWACNCLRVHTFRSSYSKVRWKDEVSTKRVHTFRSSYSKVRWKDEVSTKLMQKKKKKSQLFILKGSQNMPILAHF